ncbi:MAG: type VI secretion system baseplate subunit TssE [Gammaproteobacteria bacterium]|nr:type VI secretion system baseplate subunit TssE [Gammaproteobacteria bacterium]
MSGVRFFKRLALGIRHVDAMAFDERATVESVHEHLNKMLNTRQGSVPALPDYGLPDFNDIARRFPDSVHELRREIHRCIGQYEPRLTNVIVEYIRDSENLLDLRFEIRADVLAGDKKSKIYFETTMHSSGQIELRGW